MSKSLFALVTIVCAAAAAPAVAAPPRAQQVAMACTASADTTGCAARTHAQAPVAMSADSAARRISAQHPAAARKSNDGSRFQYDSCGCSN